MLNSYRTISNLSFYRAMDYIVQRAVLQLHVDRTSVRQFVRLYHWVDQDHIGWKS